MITPYVIIAIIKLYIAFPSIQIISELNMEGDDGLKLEEEKKSEVNNI